MNIFLELIYLYTNYFSKEKESSQTVQSTLLGKSSGVTTLAGATSGRRGLLRTTKSEFGS